MTEHEHDKSLPARQDGRNPAEQESGGPMTVDMDEAPPPVPPVETGFKSTRRIGMIMLLVVFVGFGGWAALAPIEGAARAPGAVSVKSYKKTIQHLEGGIVGEILVQNGDVVEAGDPLLVMDSTQSRVELQRARSEYLALGAREARFIAERDELDQVNYPEHLRNGEATAQAEMAAQNQVFETSKAAREGELEVLQQRIEQLQSRVEGQKALRDSKLELSDSFAEELEDTRSLLEEGFAEKTRLRELERNLASLRGEAAELLSSISSTEMQVGETRLQMLQLRKDFSTEVANDLSETQTRLKDVRERITALEDVVARTVVRAPVAGVVNGMNVHTEGGVINAGSPIAEIVPQSEELVIEARISPIDIDRVGAGQHATVRFPAFSRQVPSIDARVMNISADSHVDENTNTPYYLARLEVLPEGMEDLEGLVLVPGMPAEAFIETGSRTLLQYLMKPLSNTAARSFIED